MTTLYRPVLIESAEQAEALPVRTPVLMGPFVAHRPFADKGWVVTDAGGEYSSEELIAAHAHLTPTALVPIEAEEEWGVEYCDDGDPDDTYVIRAISRENAEWRLGRSTPPLHAWARIVNRRAATPWEEA